MHKTVTLKWRALSAVRRPRFAAPPVDLSQLVIAADALKRYTQAQLQRDALCDALYGVPPASAQYEASRHDGERAGERDMDEDDPD